jgi:hypothetical protein
MASRKPTLSDFISAFTSVSELSYFLRKISLSIYTTSQSDKQEERDWRNSLSITPISPKVSFSLIVIYRFFGSVEKNNQTSPDITK